MRGTAFATLLVLLLAATAFGQAEDGKPFFDKVRKKHYDPRAAGLAGFKAAVTLKEASDPKLDEIKEQIRFTYSWFEPDKESMDLEGVPEGRKAALELLWKGMWEDLTGTLVFDRLLAMKRLRFSDAQGFGRLTGMNSPDDFLNALFDMKTLALRNWQAYRDQAHTGVIVRFGFTEKDEVFRIEWRALYEQRQLSFHFKYEDFKEKEGFHLPTKVAHKDAGGATMAFGLDYVEVERRREKVEEFTEKEVKEAVRAFSRGWREWDADERILQIRKLSGYGHEKVSAAIAKDGLKDKDPAVRLEAAKALGALGFKNAVAGLMQAYKATEGFEKVPDEEKKKAERAVHLAAIEALGKIGDPRTIPLFAEGWGNLPEPKPGEQSTADLDYEPARAKVVALGKICHKDSVDAILEIWGVGGMHVGVLMREIKDGLKALTGQDLGHDIYAWKNWWNKNRPTFRFKKE